MPSWGWLLMIVAIAVAGLLVHWLTTIRWSKRLQSTQIHLEEVGNAAARLPDTLERAERAEAEARTLRQAVQEAAAREAMLQTQLDEAKNVKAQLQDDTQVAGQRLVDAQKTLNDLSQTSATTNAQLEMTKERLVSLTTEQASTASQLAAAQQELRELGAHHAQAVAERAAARAALEETKQFLQTAQSQLRTAFTEAASKVFDEKAMALDVRIKESAEMSRQGLESTLKPFSEKVNTFQERIEQLGKDQAREQATLVGTIGELKGLNQNMAKSTDALAKALKGNAKTRGDWGELILETVLKASGLEEGKNYFSQSGTTDEDTGQRRTPDIVVALPDGRRIVVDSKVNLIAWSEAQNAETPELEQEALVRHAAALRAHMRDLAEKNYPKLLGADALDLTILFVPIEGALSAALTINSDLQTEAFSKHVVFASPNTLMAMLRVVERLWTRDKLQKQVGVIGDEAGKLLDALTAFLGEFQDVEKKIGLAGEAFAKAKNRLTDSNQSVVARARRLVEAGAKGKKTLAEELVPVIDTANVPLLLDTSMDV